MPNETPISHAIPGKSAPRSMDARIGGLAEAQHGVVSRRQLLHLGLGRGAIEDRIARGQLRRVQWGVYAVGHRPMSRESRWMAAVLSAGPGAALSHRSAGSLWQILPRMSILPEVTRATRCQARSGLKSHCGVLSADEVTHVDGIPVTSPPRTVLDVAAFSTVRELERALNEMEVRGITDELSIPDLLERFPRKRGSAKLRVLLADEMAVQGIAREKLEERFAALLEGTDLPRPRRNAPVAVRGRFFEADCLWAEQRVIVELDGRAAHGARRAFEGDRERDRLLQVDGWRVVRITWRQLRDDAPAVLADLRALLRTPAPRPTL
jgi:predicted transcriptional regulator of viral defense system